LNKEEDNVMSFTVRRGTNISHWLSQSIQRGAARRAWFTQEDVRRIAGMGFDHIRIPIDEVQMWDESGGAHAEAFDLLQKALDWCEDTGMRAIVDLHILRSHYFNDRTGVPALFTDPAQEAHFADLWRDLSHRLGSRATNQVAYELLNEAVARDPEDWNRVAKTAFDAVRESEPERTIVLGSNWFNQHHTFERLAVPDDEYCILTFHYYYPMLVTHHQAGWWDGGVYAGPIQYPGQPIPSDAMEGLPEVVQRHLEEWNRPYDRAQMVVDWAQPLAVRARTGLPLYCGEFGVYNKTPQSIRLAWYRDIIGAFDEHDIAWANWDYKGSFGVVTAAGEDTGIAAALLR
jgi:endoglucanase